jgi:hypothetical protein
MRTINHIAAAILTIAAATGARNADGAHPVEPSPASQLEKPTSNQAAGGRCPIPMGTIRLPDTWSDSVRLDYLGEILELRIGEGGLRFYGFDRRTPYVEMGVFEFQDDTLCTGDLIDRGFDLVGTEEAETIVGTNATDRISGKQGHDTLVGADGDDIYLFEMGDSVDCIYDVSGSTTVAFGEGIAPQALMIAEVPGALERTLFLRIVPINHAGPSQGLNIRTGSQTGHSPLLFRFADGNTLTSSELQQAASSGRLDVQALANEHVCYFDIQEAERAGQLDKRAKSPPMPRLPLVGPMNDTVTLEVHQCTALASGEHSCH